MSESHGSSAKSPSNFPRAQGQAFKLLFSFSLCREEHKKSWKKHMSDIFSKQLTQMIAVYCIKVCQSTTQFHSVHSDSDSPYTHHYESEQLGSTISMQYSSSYSSLFESSCPIFCPDFDSGSVCLSPLKLSQCIMGGCACARIEITTVLSPQAGAVSSFLTTALFTCDFIQNVHTHKRVHQNKIHKCPQTKQPWADPVSHKSCR